MIYLKLFNQDSEYKAFKESEEYILPNVSFIQESNSVAYNPYAEAKETRVVCTYNVTDTTSATKVCYLTSGFTSMEVDGVLLDSVTTGYTFDVVGEHTVKFELANPTHIGSSAFRGCSGLTSIVIPDSVTIIEGLAFYGCSGLTSLHIGSGVTSIGNSAFGGCSGLNEITCNAITAPTIGSNTFKNIKQGGILKVPAGSDYSSWMSTGDYYLGKYNWTVEYI